MSITHCIRILILIAVLWPVWATAVDRYVSPAGTDTGACTSTASPCATIQYAVDQAADKDTVKASQGVYNESIEIMSAVSNLVIQGGWNSDFSMMSGDPSLTVLDGVSGSVFNIWEKMSQTVDVTLEGFTIRNGNAQYGGGVRVFSIDGGSTTVTIRNNVISGNWATQGGGVHVSSNNGTTTVKLIDNIIKANNGQTGGGIFVGSQKKGTVSVTSTNDFIIDNASSDRDAGHAAFVSSDNGNTTLIFLNSTIAGNVVPGNGVGVFIRAYRNGTTQVTLQNAILWGNSNDSLDSYDMLIYEDDSFGDASLLVTASYSDIGDVKYIKGSYLVKSGVINKDPLFSNPTEGNYRLKSGSPAIGAGACGTILFPGFTYVRIAPSDDYEGDLRPGEGAVLNECEMGADEYVKMASPVGRQSWTYPGTIQAEVRTNPSAAKPIGFGSVANGGDKLKLQISIAEIAGPSDIYLALYSKNLNPTNVYLIKSDLSLKPVSQGLAPWKANTTGGLNEYPYGEISISGLPSGTYVFAIMLTPAGSLAASYLWITTFVIP